MTKGASDSFQGKRTPALLLPTVRPNTRKTTVAMTRSNERLFRQLPSAPASFTLFALLALLPQSDTRLFDR